jgi:hypothetical protein
MKMFNYFRLLKNFSVCKDGMVVVSQFSKMYAEATGPTVGKENALPDNEVGRITKQVFPTITLHKVRFQGKRSYAYKGIAIRSMSVSEPLLTLKDLEDFDPGYVFCRGVYFDKFREWHKMIRKSLMSKEELLQELKEEKRKRINTQRREAYLREKIEREMLEFVKEDNDDFVEIFQNVPDEKVPEDMKLLWQEQAKAVSATSATSRRWHPK